MFGFGKDKSLKDAENNLYIEFGLTLNDLPDKRPVIDLFESMSKQGRLSTNAKTSLLYRLVAMNYLAVSKLMRDQGKDTPPEKLLWLTTLMDASVTWSENSPDRINYEQLTSQLNMNLVNFLESFGIHNGNN